MGKEAHSPTTVQTSVGTFEVDIVLGRLYP